MLKKILTTLILVYVFFVFILKLSSLTSAERIKRLVGASDAKLGEFPWIVSLQQKKYLSNNLKNSSYHHFCGSGSIIDKFTIATAAHCVFKRRSSELQILAGILDIDQQSIKNNHQQRMNVKEIRIHPNYTQGDDNQPGMNDIALLKLESPLEFNNYVNSIEISTEVGQPAENFDCCFTMGWGNQLQISTLYFIRSMNLQKLKSNIIPNLYCQFAYPFLQNQLTNTICVTSGLLRGSCNGDSGNPLICYKNTSDNHKSKRKPYLVGVGSWGWMICGDVIHPDVFTDIRIIRSIS